MTGLGVRVSRAAAFAWERVVRYALKFGVVGLVGFVIDTVLFNLLRVGTFGDDHFFQSALGAKIASTSVAIVFNWIGNRYWTFRAHRRRRIVREFVEYAIVSLGGLAIGLACLAISHHLLGLTSLVADNIAANVVGLGLGTMFRFVLYRYWVYGHHRDDGIEGETATEVAELALFMEPGPPDARSTPERTGDR